MSQAQNLISTDPDLQSLKTFIDAEVLAPDVLVYQEHTVSRAHEILEKKNAVLAHPSVTKEHLLIEMMELEVCKIRHLIAEYHRTRLQKIENHAIYFLSNAEARERLSEAELTFCIRYVDMFEEAMKNGVLGSLPDAPSLRSLVHVDETTGQDMVNRPDMDKLVRAKTAEPQDNLFIGNRRYNLKAEEEVEGKYSDILPALQEEKLFLV
eukprot:TRINITY_DN3065_c0_g1_i2.p1 TRINITY_DN3065_c0_g1~~TRINITY_DN3065_c0_g1_i2.p1  ORF type:complete len:209 (-),score=37.36 TRINITY_DN3065_c0_g1_i2:60-686(-)